MRLKRFNESVNEMENPGISEDAFFKLNYLYDEGLNIKEGDFGYFLLSNISSFMPTIMINKGKSDCFEYVKKAIGLTKVSKDDDSKWDWPTFVSDFETTIIILYDYLLFFEKALDYTLSYDIDIEILPSKKRNDLMDNITAINKGKLPKSTNLNIYELNIVIPYKDKLDMLYKCGKAYNLVKRIGLDIVSLKMEDEVDWRRNEEVKNISIKIDKI